MTDRADATTSRSHTSGPEADRVRRAMREQLSDPDREPTTLREAVCAFVAMLRDRGLPPERTLVAVKDVISSAYAPNDILDRQRELASRVATWCVEEYYRAA